MPYGRAAPNMLSGGTVPVHGASFYTECVRRTVKKSSRGESFWTAMCLKTVVVVSVVICAVDCS